MFDRLRFKSKKTDSSSSSSSSAASVLPGHKAETSDSSSPSLAANFLGRSSSHGSTHRLQQKTSLSSLNNLYNSHHHSRSNFDLINNTNGDDNYKVPLEDNSCSIKVPIPETEDRPRSQTINNFSQYQQDHHSPTSHESERRSSQGPRTNPATKPAVGTFAGATVTSTPPSDVPGVGSSSGGITPSPASASTPASAYASATSSATPSRSSSTSNRGGAGISTGSFTPLSATPPLTPRLAHEAADISHANGHDTAAGAGSLGNADLPNHALARDRLTPLPQHTHPSGQSATSSPATAATVVGHYQRQQQLQQQQVVPVIYGGASSTADEGAMSPSTAFVSSPISYQPPSNPLSIQGSTQQQTLHPQDSFQHQHVPVAGSGLNSSAAAHDSLVTDAEITHDSMHRAKSLVQQAFAANRETLHKQQQYQEQQMRQFREDLSNSRSSSSNSVPQKNELQGEPQSLPSSSTAHGQDMPIVSALAVAAALASESSSSPDHGTKQTDTHMSSINTKLPLLQDDSQQQQQRSRDRTTSAPGTVGPFESPSSANQSPYPLSGTNQACTGSSGTNGGTSSSAHGHGAGTGTGASGTGYGGIAGGGSSFFPSPISRASTSMAAAHLVTHDVRQVSGRSHIEDGAGPLVLMAIGKTGQGKSSLLNKIMGTNELKASASVRAVTKGIAERTGWGRFEDSRRVLVTEYIRSVGTRVGVSAFLLVFKIDSGVDMIITILQAFNEIMKDFPNFWDNVVLVFTGCDYRRNVMNTKQLYHEEVQRQLQEHFFKDLYSASGGGDGPSGADHRPSLSTESSSTSTATATSSNATLNGSSGMAMLSEEMTPVVPMVFLTCAEAPCGFSLGEKCDCKARTTFLNAGIKRLWYAVRNKKRWVLDQDENDDLLGHS
ncbi:hypothetical protein BGZ72_010987 [Mortierella alpina]|nr:hypothetical protein BGZ72_010987 [Mortierella alpina]